MSKSMHELNLNVLQIFRSYDISNRDHVSIQKAGEIKLAIPELVSSSFSTIHPPLLDVECYDTLLKTFKGTADIFP